jgi:uncharacterized protein (TIGR02145 family)
MKKYFVILVLTLIWACNKNDYQNDLLLPNRIFTSEETEIAPSSFLVFTSPQKITKDTVAVQIGTAQATLIKLDTFRMGMWVPMVPSGDYTINLSKAGGQDSFSIRILPVEPIIDPAIYLSDIQEQSGRISDSLANYQSQGILSANDIAFMRELKNRIDAGISGLTSSQKEELAFFTKQFNTSRSTIKLPIIDTSLIVPGLNQNSDPALQFTNEVNNLLSINQKINRLSILNLMAADFFNKKDGDLYELAYLLTLEFYMLEKHTSLLFNKHISSFACVAEGGLNIKEGAATNSTPLKVIRGRSVTQRIEGTFRTINPSDETLLNGKVAQLYSYNNALVKGDVTIKQKWNFLKTKYNDLMTAIPSLLSPYVSPLPVTSKYRTTEISPSALVISRVSNPGISVVTSQNSDGSLRLTFNSSANTIPDGTTFNLRMNYNQEALGRSASLSQVLSFDNYPNVAIGGKIWMQENTAVKFFRNGDAIPYVSWGPTWATLKTPAWCYYNNDPSSEATYGLLYNWYAVSDPRGFAPEGWHVATDTEWKDMIAFLGGNAVAGGILKAVSPLWNAPNTGATNSSGFSALPAGSRGNGGTYVNLGRSTAWWTANQYGPNGSWSYYAGHNTSSVTRGGASKQDGYSVRCVKD